MAFLKFFYFSNLDVRPITSWFAGLVSLSNIWKSASIAAHAAAPAHLSKCGRVGGFFRSAQPAPDNALNE
jgi:hypothetical protein